MGPLEVKYEHIEALKDLQLTRLLKMLLHLEADAHGITHSAVSVSLKINVPDGGEDGRIQWKDGPKSIGYIPNRFTMFQNKTKEMWPKDCLVEMLVSTGDKLKPGVQEVLDAKGSYILFLGRHCNPNQQKSRIEAFREALTKVGRSDDDTASIQIYDAQKIADWTNQSWPAVAHVLEQNGIRVPYGFKTWDAWEKAEGRDFEYVI